MGLVNKVLVLLTAVALLQGCGVKDSLNDACEGSDIEGFCDFVFGYKDRQQNVQTEYNKKDIQYLLGLYDQMALSARTANQLAAEQQVATEAQLAEINAEIARLEDTTADLQVQITEEALKTKVISFIDPCDDKPGAFDEVLLRAENGQLVAYFEQGGNRFLSILSPGSYRTTDSQACNFTVDSNNNVIF